MAPLALRAVQGLFAGYGSLSVAMAAESAPRDKMPQAIGSRPDGAAARPAVGPVIGGVLARLVGLRGAFLVTAMFYAAGLVLVFLMHDDRATHAHRIRTRPASRSTRHVPQRPRLRELHPRDGRHFSGLQFVDRSFGPVLPLYVEQVGVAHDRVAVMSGILFSIMACTGALGHHLCGKLLHRFPPRVVIAGGAAVAAAGSLLIGVSGNIWMMCAASVLLGIGIGAAMTAAYSAAGSVIPAGAHGTGFGVLTSASLVGMASSPFAAGLLGGTSIRVVFFVNVALMGIIAGMVQKRMVDAPGVR